MVRRSLQRLGARAAGMTGHRHRRDRRVVVLCYHSVHPTAGYATVTPELFERHLSWLSETCDVVPFRDALGEAAVADRTRPAVSLTFDDGYLDNYEIALPLLQKYALPATIFLTTGLVDGDAEVLARFRDLRGTSVEPLEWHHARELLAAGVEIGAHTHSHPNLACLDRSKAVWELRHSKQLIEDRLDTRVDLVAYPFGKPRRHFESTTTELARDTGYSHAAAIMFRAVRRDDSPLAIPRFFTARDSIDQLAAKVRGDWDYLGFFQEHVPIPLARLLSPQDFRW